MYSSAKLRSIQSTSRNTAKIACSIICIIWLGFENKEQEDGYPLWYTASKHKASLRDRLCFNLPGEVSVGRTNQLPKHYCLLQSLSVLLRGLPGCVSRARDLAVICKVGSQGRVVWPREMLPREKTTNCVCAALHTVILPATCLVGFLFCFSCGYMWRDLSVTI